MTEDDFAVPHAGWWISIGLGLTLANRLLADGGWFAAPATAAVAGMLSAALALLACATVAHVIFLGVVAGRAGSRPPLALVEREPGARKHGR